MAFLLVGVGYAVFGPTRALADSLDNPEPRVVEVGIFVVDVDAVGTVEQNFTANVVLRVRWSDPRQAHDGPGSVMKPLAAVDYPQVQIVNQQRLHATFPEMAEVEPDGRLTYRQRYWGNFSQPLDLRDFPFDAQEFRVELAVAGATVGELEVIVDERFTGMAERFSVPDWRVTDWSASPSVYDAIPGRRLPGATFRFAAERRQDYFVVKVIVPLVLIVMMSWVVFFTRPGESSTDIGVAVTVMLTLIAYRFAIGSFLPVISYLTRLDFFILGATILVFSSLAQVVVTGYLARSGHRTAAINVDRVCRVLFPTAFVYILVQSFWLPFVE